MLGLFTGAIHIGAAQSDELNYFKAVLRRLKMIKDLPEPLLPLWVSNRRFGCWFSLQGQFNSLSSNLTAAEIERSMKYTFKIFRMLES